MYLTKLSRTIRDIRIAANSRALSRAIVEQDQLRAHINMLQDKRSQLLRQQLNDFLMDRRS